MKKLLALMSTLIILMFFASCTNANNVSVQGKFYGSYEATDNNGNTDTYYDFRSNDGSVWWSLTEAQMGFVPKANTEYMFTYNNNGTKDCSHEDCECEVYDDTFVAIREMN